MVHCTNSSVLISAIIAVLLLFCFLICSAQYSVIELLYEVYV